MSNLTPPPAMPVTTDLIANYKASEPFARRGSRAGRWHQMRHIFHEFKPCWPAINARWAILDCGPRTRERWITEYRHQRTLLAINEGRQTGKPESGETWECPACGGTGHGRSRESSDHPDRRTKCKTCNGRRTIPAPTE